MNVIYKRDRDYPSQCAHFKNDLPVEQEKLVHMCCLHAERRVLQDQICLFIEIPYIAFEKHCIELLFQLFLKKPLIFFRDIYRLIVYVWELYDQKGRYYRTIDRVWGMVVPMGYINSVHNNNCDWIDTHSTLTFGPAYPALWLDRKDVSLRSMMKQK